jgi:hypothetical protein
MREEVAQKSNFERLRVGFNVNNWFIKDLL